jgi:hypothetical protein
MMIRNLTTDELQAELQRRRALTQQPSIDEGLSDADLAAIESRPVGTTKICGHCGSAIFTGSGGEDK